MIGRWLHPSTRRLDRFMDGDLTARQHARTAAHVSGCGRCFARLQSAREVIRRIRELPVPPPSDAVLARIRATLASGTAMIPSAEGPIPIDPPGSSRRRFAVLGPLVLLFPLVLALMVPRLEGWRATLTVSSATPLAGEHVRVIYRGGLVAGEDEPLRARVQLHDAEGVVETVGLPLDRRRSGARHEAGLTLPPWAVYARFVVEDPTGEHVDANHGRMWEVLVHDAQGRPLLEALDRRFAVHFSAHPAGAIEAARAMVEHYPDRALSWRTFLAAESRWADRETLDSLVVRFEDRFRRFERRFNVSPPAPEELAAMTLYAWSLGDQAAARRWGERLVDEAPGLRLAVQLRLQQLDGELGGDPQALLDGYEGLWQATGPQRDIAATAFVLALRAGDGDAALRWADRRARLDPAAGTQVAIGLSTIPGSRDAGMRRIRSELRRMDEGADAAARPLASSVSEYRVVQEQRKRRLLVALGDALIAEGRNAAGTDTLLVASELGWDPEVFRTAADALLAASDTMDALPLLARVRADPETSTPEREELDSLALRHATPWEWEEYVGEAERRMSRQVRAEALRRRLPQTISVEDRDGRRRDLRAVLDGGVAVVSLWHCLCDQLAQQIVRHQALEAKLAEFDIALITVVTGRMGLGAESAPAAESTGLARLYDFDGQALQAFGSRAASAYFIVDGRGFVRFSHAAPDQVLRQALTLRGERGPAGLAPE